MSENPSNAGRKRCMQRPARRCAARDGELQASTQATQAELGACRSKLIESERKMEELRAIIRAKGQESGDASQEIDALAKQCWQSNALRNNLAEELINSKTRMETKICTSKSRSES
jgi:hypothetical protein